MRRKFKLYYPRHNTDPIFVDRKSFYHPSPHKDDQYFENNRFCAIIQRPGQSHIRGSQLREEMKIEMTAPVSTKVEAGAGPNCESTFTVSFFIPHEHQENPPQPKNTNVFLEERPGFEAYVRTFGGFANDESWVTEAQKLSEDLKEKTEEIRQDYWYSAGYNSPFQLFGRTNEIWFVKK
ncbi:heme-binding protein 2-like isoform X3 [Ostrea edulis]|uniref:heme-binding protein 2-like isoform X3 n=1 Tax=Ostrea edulis TaxID=37623 RepID=UPI0024AFCCDC|nr:heme-binding protein 2-like isoform X3 [Ostrea edulis]